MGAGKFSARSNPEMDLHPIQGGVLKNPSSCFMLQKSKISPGYDRLLSSYADLTLVGLEDETTKTVLMCPCGLIGRYSMT